MANRKLLSLMALPPPFPPDSDELITLAVQKERFEIITAALTTNSAYFRAMFTGPIATTLKAPPRHADGAYIIQADPEIFKHVHSFLQTNTYPLLWNMEDGFDEILYSRIFQTAHFFQITDLTDFISEQRYRRVIQTTKSYDVNPIVAESETYQSSHGNCGSHGGHIGKVQFENIVTDCWRCPSGHINDPRCRDLNCWGAQTPVTSKRNLTKVITLTSEVKFDYAKLR